LGEQDIVPKLQLMSIGNLNAEAKLSRGTLKQKIILLDLGKMSQD
jgi:hypothetical protein